MDDNPPDHFARHHVKEASFYDVSTYKRSLVIKLPESHDYSTPYLMRVNFIGIQENAMWPGKIDDARASGELGPAMSLFERLDKWLDEQTRGAVDALLLGCIGGVVDL